jgi:hypothetical protein
MISPNGASVRPCNAPETTTFRLCLQSRQDAHDFAGAGTSRAPANYLAGFLREHAMRSALLWLIGIPIPIIIILWLVTGHA